MQIGEAKLARCKQEKCNAKNGKNAPLNALNETTIL